MKLTSVEPIGRSQLIPGVRPTVGEEHEEAAPGATTARGVNPADGAAAAPQESVCLLAGYGPSMRGQGRRVSTVSSRGRQRWPSTSGVRPRAVELSHSDGVFSWGAPQHRRAYQPDWRAASRPPGSRRRRRKRESGVRSGLVPGWPAPGQWGLEGEAVEQADAADEGRLEESGSIAVGRSAVRLPSWVRARSCALRS